MHGGTSKNPSFLSRTSASPLRPRALNRRETPEAVGEGTSYFEGSLRSRPGEHHDNASHSLLYNESQKAATSPLFKSPYEAKKENVAIRRDRPV